MSESLAPRTTQRVPLPTWVAGALVGCLLLGLGGLINGCDTIQFYRQPTPASPALDARVEPQFQAWLNGVHQARIDHLIEFSGRVIPMAAAHTLLAALLLIACSRALAGRPRAHSLAVQAVVANALYALVSFILERPLRSAMIDAASRLPVGSFPDGGVSPAVVGWWLFRALLVMQLLVFAAVAFGLTRPRVAALYNEDLPEQDL